MKVVLADIDEANLSKAETELKIPGRIVLGVRMDVSKRSDVELLARQAIAAFGGVHLVFNNAGGRRRWSAMGGNMERLGVGNRGKFMGRDPWGQGVHAAHACTEYGVPYRQYVLSRRARRR